MDTENITPQKTAAEKVATLYAYLEKRNNGLMENGRPGMFVKIHTNSAVLGGYPILEIVKVHKRMFTVRTGQGTRRVHVGHVLKLMTASEGRQATQKRWESYQDAIKSYAAQVAASTGKEKNEARKWLWLFEGKLARWRKWEVYDHFEQDNG
jgi:hypothetical protein